jgi:hypothetical protein
VGSGDAETQVYEREHLGFHLRQPGVEPSLEPVSKNCGQDLFRGTEHIKDDGNDPRATNAGVVEDLCHLMNEFEML